MKKLIAFILSTSLAILPVTVKATGDVSKDNSVCVNTLFNTVLNENCSDIVTMGANNLFDSFKCLDGCENYKDCLDKLIFDKFGVNCNNEDKPQIQPDEKPDIQPEEKPEQKPDIRPEEKPEQRPDIQPEEKPEQKPDNDTTVGIENAEYVNRVISLVNQERAKVGLSALKADSSLNKVALVRAKETVKSFSHTRPNGTSCFTALDEYGVKYSGAGENIAYGQSSPEQVVNAWMNSEGHRANILNANFTKIGVGCHKNGSTLYWAQMFTY